MCFYTNRRIAMFRFFLAPLLLQALLVGPSLAQAGPDTPAKAAAREQMRLQRSLFNPPKPAPQVGPLVQGGAHAIPPVVNTNPPRSEPVQPTTSQPSPAPSIPHVVDLAPGPDGTPLPASRRPLAAAPVLDLVPKADAPPASTPPVQTGLAGEAPSSPPAVLSPRKLKVDL